jgi:inner membrane protein
MDAFTHALTGVLIAKAIPDRNHQKSITRILWSSALFPDIDIILYLFGFQTYLFYHRGITHSFIGLPLFTLLLAALFYYLGTLKRFWYLTFLCSIGLISHIILDLITSYGTIIFYPVSTMRYALDYVFIIDLVIISLVTFPLVYIRLTKKREEKICRLALVLLLLYLVFAAFQHKFVLNKLRNICQEKGLVVQRMDVLPQPPIPFKWLGLVETPQGIYQYWIHLGQKKGFSYQWFPYTTPNKYIARAEKLDTVKLYRWFARYPIIEYKSVDKEGRYIVEYFDLRFNTKLFGLHHRPFVLQIVFDTKGEVLSQSFLKPSY